MTMGWFGSKDWNVVAIIFERSDLYPVNGNRGRGGEATTIRYALKQHPRTIFWGVFDQKGAFLEGGRESDRGLSPLGMLPSGDRPLSSGPDVSRPRTDRVICR